MPLTDGEYDAYVRLAGNELKVNGKGMHERLNEIVTSDPEYMGASDAVKGIIITRMVSAYRTAAAVQELLKPNEDGSASSLMTAWNARLTRKADALGAVPTPATTPRPQR